MKPGDKLSHPLIPFRTDHRREAARLRWLATSATTSALKARLLEQAQQHERLASLERHSDVPGTLYVVSGLPD
jgi:hypothetical protein